MSESHVQAQAWLAQAWQEVRCPRCNRLLFRARGLSGLVEIKCVGCKSMIGCRAAVEAAIITERAQDEST